MRKILYDISRTLLAHHGHGESLESIAKQLEIETVEAARVLIPRVASWELTVFENEANMVYGCLEMFSQLENRQSIGFIPKIALLEDPRIRGFDCLGRAAAFGALLRTRGMDVSLAIISDRVMCMVTINGQRHLCDPTANLISKMGMSFTYHPHYQMYMASAEEKFDFFYVAIQDFTMGIVNAACGSFQYLQDVAEMQKNDTYVRATQQQLSFVSLARSVDFIRHGARLLDWKDVRSTLFGEIDGYLVDYALEWEVQAEHIFAIRTEREMERRFDALVLVAAERLGYIGKISQLHDEIISKMADIADQVIGYLDRGSEIYSDHSVHIAEYISVISDGTAADPLFRRYVISKMKKVFITIQKEKIGKEREKGGNSGEEHVVCSAEDNELVR